MSLSQALRKRIPPSAKKVLRPLANAFMDKNNTELSFWRERLKQDNGLFKNAHYKRIFLAMAQEKDAAFVKDKIIADFGCGPRGSLTWAKHSALRIGIDVLADRYIDAFADNLLKHNMIYLKSTEKVIPLPSNFVDIIFTLNALDHVDNFSIMSREIIRILKPGGHFIGSFNLEEKATPCEPQCLDLDIIQHDMLNHLKILSYRTTQKGPPKNQFEPFFENKTQYSKGKQGFLWVKAEKPF